MSDIVHCLKNFKVAKYSFITRPSEKIMLSEFKGATLRGGFGYAFKRICCVNKNVDSCNKCLLKEKCAYSYIFETSPTQKFTKLRKITNIPRPFVFEFKDEKNIYTSNGNFSFDLILFGNAIDYLPYFIFVFDELGKIGIGKRRGRYSLKKVTDSMSNEIYNSSTGAMKNIDSNINIEQILSSAKNWTDAILIHFITPTRIKYNSRLVSELEFHVFIRALLHRISSLMYFHCNEELKIDYRDLISQSKNVKTKWSKLKWVDYKRYSTRQKTYMKFGGITGKILYEGDLKPFLPLMLIGQYTHIGKNCTFGLGKYVIIRDNQDDKG